MNDFSPKILQKGGYVLVKPFYIDIKPLIDLKLYEGRGTLKIIKARKAGKGYFRHLNHKQEGALNNV